jgi:hypothetical protein
MEKHSRFHGTDWSPQRVAFHQNLEEFADRVGLIVGLQSNGKVGQEETFRTDQNDVVTPQRQSQGLAAKK